VTILWLGDGARRDRPNGLMAPADRVYVQEARLFPVIGYEPRAHVISQRVEPGHIYLARHGRTALNAAGALRGQIDVPLDSVGQRQVSRLGVALAGKKPRLVISSPLLRAVTTGSRTGTTANGQAHKWKMSSPAGARSMPPRGSSQPK
jgi:hypothetical protein